MNAWVMNTSRNSFRELVGLRGVGEKGGAFMPLGRWPEYLGQGLCGWGRGVGRSLSTYSGTVGSEDGVENLGTL